MESLRLPVIVRVVVGQLNVPDSGQSSMTSASIYRLTSINDDEETKHRRSKIATTAGN